MLNNIVDNIEQCGQHNIVQGQPRTQALFTYENIYYQLIQCVIYRSVADCASAQESYYSLQ